MADDNFGPLISFTDVEDAVQNHFKRWLSIWLPARERRLGIPTGTIARPRSYIVKQTFTALPGEELTPLVITVSNGFAAEPEQHGDGQIDAVLRFGVAVVCLGTNPRALAGHYQAVIVGIAMKHQAIADNIALFDFIDLRIEDIDDEVLGRTMTAVRIDLAYKVQSFAETVKPPAWIEPPPDPVPPQPDDPEVETVITDVESVPIEEPA
jgi:hypothetical protein